MTGAFASHLRLLSYTSGPRKSQGVSISDAKYSGDQGVPPV